jgi:hypothetical protein
VTGDRYRTLTAAAVLLVAGIAAVVSYLHIVRLALAYGQEPLAAYLLPLSIDGMVATSSLVMLRAARTGVSTPWLARSGLVLAVAATLAANVAAGLPHGWPGALLSGWPAVAFIVSAETVISMSRRRPARGHQADTGPATKRPAARPRNGQGRRSQSQADLEAAALTVLAARPDMTGAELGRQLGLSERTGRRILSQLASTT